MGRRHFPRCPRVIQRIGTRQGIFVVQSIKKKPPDHQWSMDLLKTISGLPWNLRPGGPSKIPAPADLVPELPEAQAPVRAVPKDEPWRRMYLRKQDFARYGHTAGCEACSAIREGRSRSGILHSEPCRKRILEALRRRPRKVGR